MADRRRRSSNFTSDGIKKLPDDKPVVYKIKGERGQNLYTGSAKRGRVRERLSEHLPGAKDPIRGGSKVQLFPKHSIDEAQKVEQRIIKRDKPPRNKAGK